MMVIMLAILNKEQFTLIAQCDRMSVQCQGPTVNNTYHKLSLHTQWIPQGDTGVKN